MFKFYLAWLMSAKLRKRKLSGNTDNFPRSLDNFWAKLWILSDFRPVFQDPVLNMLQNGGNFSYGSKQIVNATRLWFHV